MKPITLLPLFAVFAVACGQKAEKEIPVKEATNMVTLTSAQLKNMAFDTANLMQEEKELTLTGKVTFDQSKVEKIYPLVGGNVLKVAVSLGDYVHKNQVLCVIRSTEISDLQSQYTVALNNLNVAKKNLDIAEELYNTHNYSEVQVIGARHDYAAAEADLKRLTQALAVYGASATDDALYNVTSPIDGYVVEKNVNEDMDIRPDNNTNVFTVSALNTVWVLANVYESDLSQVKEGLPVDIATVAYPGTIFHGTIYYVDNVLDPDSKVAHARIQLDNSKGLLRPEMFAEVTVHINLPNKLVTISKEAIVFQHGENYVLVRKSQDTFELRPVSIGTTNSADRVYVLSGLRPGEVVITKGSIYAANVE